MYKPIPTKVIHTKGLIRCLINKMELNPAKRKPNIIIYCVIIKAFLLFLIKIILPIKTSTNKVIGISVAVNTEGWFP